MTPWGDRPLRMLGGPKDDERSVCSGWELNVAVMRHDDPFQPRSLSESRSFDVAVYYPGQLPDGEWVLVYGPIMVRNQR